MTKRDDEAQRARNARMNRLLRGQSDDRPTDPDPAYDDVTPPANRAMNRLLRAGRNPKENN